MNLLEKDKHYVWHPFTQAALADTPLFISHAKGSYLYDHEGNTYLDMIASWWVNTHGHCHPKISQAITEQSLRLEHVIFGGCTHEPAILLAEKLSTLLPDPLHRVFYSDNGSSAVEIALKMAYQYWYNKQQPQKKLFIAFEGGYHGDTFGSMSVGYSSGYFNPFAPLLFSVKNIPYPEDYMGNTEIIAQEESAFEAFKNIIDQHKEEIAGLIIEPLIQGASGMRMARGSFIKRITDYARAHAILVIFDEVMTGFGRTGEMFACQKAQATPDIICLAKGLTGGFLPLAVTICTEHIYEGFYSTTPGFALLHGHSFSANPLGCAAALATLALFEQENTLAHIAALEMIHKERLASLKNPSDGIITKLRFCGVMAAFELDDISGIVPFFLKHNILIRPLKNTFYLLPPYSLTQQELHYVYDIIEKFVN